MSQETQALVPTSPPALPWASPPTSLNFTFPSDSKGEGLCGLSSFLPCNFFNSMIKVHELITTLHQALYQFLGLQRFGITKMKKIWSLPYTAHIIVGKTKGIHHDNSIILVYTILLLSPPFSLRNIQRT